MMLSSNLRYNQPHNHGYISTTSNSLLTGLDLSDKRLIQPSTREGGNRKMYGREEAMSGPSEGVLDEVDGDEPGTLPVSTFDDDEDDVLQQHSRPHNVSAVARYPRFGDAEIRKRTFMAWTNAFPDVTALIESGFFFLGGRDSVQCFQCGIILHSWEEEDTPDGEHMKHSSNCAFIERKLAGGAENGPQTIQEQRAPTGPARTEVIRKVTRLGHQEDLVIKAFEKLRISGTSNINTHKLLDAVYSLEDDEFNEAQAKATMEVVSDNEVDDAEKLPTAEGAAKSSPPYRLQQSSASDGQPMSLDAANRLVELEKENENLRQRTLCRVCDDRPATELFLPCGHLACCDQCTNKLELCPFCRKKIQRTYHVYMP